MDSRSPHCGKSGLISDSRFPQCGEVGLIRIQNLHIVENPVGFRFKISTMWRSRLDFDSRFSQCGEAGLISIRDFHNVEKSDLFLFKISGMWKIRIDLDSRFSKGGKLGFNRRRDLPQCGKFGSDSVQPVSPGGIPIYGDNIWAPICFPQLFFGNSTVLYTFAQGQDCFTCI